MLLPLKDTISNRGRWPSKVNDYLAAGRPIVASAVGDIQELFSQHRIGIAIKDTPEAFSDVINELLSDAFRLDEFGKNARHVAETKFAWPILAQQLETHYFKILDH